MKRIIISSILILMVAFISKGNHLDFNEWHCDSTLRADFILNGNSLGSQIALHNLSLTPDWAGRRVNLDSLALRGNGQIELVDIETGRKIFANSFSTLYQEWLTTDEAKEGERSYEATLLMPMPKKDAWLNIILLNETGDTIAHNSHRISHDDILIRRHEADPKVDYRVIHQGGDPREIIDVVIVAEGYQADEMEKFYTRAAETVESLRSHEPFGSRMNDFNFYAVGVASADTGVSIPRLNQWKDTAVGSHFSTFYSNRYLTTPNVFRLHDLLRGIPYEHIIVLANTEEYGGGGIYNAYTLTTADNEYFKPVVVHEFGHSFGGLADEYAYDGPDIIIVPEKIGYEPWEQNVTSLVDFDKKWADMLPDGIDVPTEAESAVDPLNDVGVYRGANYSTTLFYRPAITCRMRDNHAKGFCPVCQRAISRMIDFNIIPLDPYSTH